MLQKLYDGLMVPTCNDLFLINMRQNCRIFLCKISPVKHNIAVKILLLIYSYKTDGNNISLVRFHL